MIKYDFSSITVPKFGNSDDENEDSHLEPSKSKIETDSISQFAISDGATESSFSKEWSDLLVSAYKDKRFDKEHLAETLKSVSESWQSRVNLEELPWYAQQKAEMGAFATFLGLTINSQDGCFEIVAIGDCALFQIRNEEVFFTFPVFSSKEFDNTPNLFSTNQKYQPDFEKAVMYGKGTISSKDIIILATDALAAWIFKEKEAGNKPWDILIDILSKNDFEKWLNEKKHLKEMKNDDVTLLIIRFE